MRHFSFLLFVKDWRGEGEDLRYVLLENWRRSVADQSKSRPIHWARLVTEFLKKIEFGLPQCCALVGTIRKVLVEPFHEADRESIVGRPEARDHRFRACQKESALETCDS